MFRCVSSQCRRKSQFTLIELLVVLSIFSILAMLLMPSLKNAIQVALLTNCKSNMGNTGLAVLMYTSDHDDAFPGVDVVSGDYEDYWKSCISEYMGFDAGTDDVANWHKGGAMSCPLAQNINSEGYGGFSGTIGMNYHIRNIPVIERPVEYTGQIISPSKFGLLFDAASGASGGRPLSQPLNASSSHLDQWTWDATIQPNANAYAVPNLLHFATADAFLTVSQADHRSTGFYYNGKGTVTYGDMHVGVIEFEDLIFGYDGSPHHNYTNGGKGSSCTTVHDKARHHYCERPDRTFESMQFWQGK